MTKRFQILPEWQFWFLDILSQIPSTHSAVVIQFFPRILAPLCRIFWPIFFVAFGKIMLNLCRRTFDNQPRYCAYIGMDVTPQVTIPGRTFSLRGMTQLTQLMTQLTMTLLTNLTAKENNSSQTTPAMQTVQVWIFHVVVEIKHCLQTPNCDCKGYQLKNKVDQLHDEFVLISKHSVHNHS